MNKNETCTHCGTTPVYAKGLCKNCYVRKNRTGSTDYIKPKYVGKLINGWLVTETKEITKINNIPYSLILCVYTHCGKQKYFTYSQIYTERLGSCICGERPLQELKKTPKQQEIVDAYLNNDRSYTKAANELNISRQYVCDCIQKLRKKVELEQLNKQLPSVNQLFNDTFNEACLHSIESWNSVDLKNIWQFYKKLTNSPSKAWECLYKLWELYLKEVKNEQ